MGLNEKYKKGVLTHIDTYRRGEIAVIPNPLARVHEVFNLLQNRYTTLIGATGSGKTSFADFLWVLQPWTMYKSGALGDNVHFEVMYFSLERKAMFKHAKWLSWFIYRDCGIQLSADDILGFSNKEIDDDMYDFIRTYDDEISELISSLKTGLG